MKKTKMMVNIAGAFGLATTMQATNIVSTGAAENDLDNCRHIGGGEASWYGPGFNGKRTAHGDIFNENAMTAAHNSLPEDTMVTVVADNGRMAELRVNDTGGFGKYGRVLDASKAGAIALGYKDAGTAHVNLYLC